MSNSPVLAHCAECGPDRRADIIFQYEQELAVSPHTGMKTFRVLQCRGCSDVFFETKSVIIKGPQIDEEEVIFLDDQTTRVQIDYWPPRRKRSVPDWSIGLWLKDEELHDLFAETYAAFNSGLSVLTAIGMRTVFDRATLPLGINPSLTFGEKLSQLEKLDCITKTDHEGLETLVDAGSAATHRGWKPIEEQLDLMFLILEGFLHRVFILPDRAGSLAKGVPPKPPRKV